MYKGEAQAQGRPLWPERDEQGGRLEAGGGQRPHTAWRLGSTERPEMASLPRVAVGWKILEKSHTM